MKFMSFLGNVQVAAKEKADNAVGKKKDRNPVTADIRVFKTGAVYPSANLVQRFELEYTTKDSPTPGFGFDVIDGRLWANLKTEQPALFIAPVRRDLGKVDLFGQCSYDDNNNPVVDVMQQGSTTFGKKLLAMVAEVYGVTITEEKDYIDLTLVAIPEVNAMLKATTKGVLHLPKTVSRGDDKGTATYVRRESTTVYGFVPAQLLETNDEPGAEDFAEEVPGTFAELQEGLEA